jgi:histidine triad (HIT) family protein
MTGKDASEQQACIFCKIVRGQIPSAFVLQTDGAVAFMDINPVNRGHILVVPRAHHVDLTDIPEDLAAHVGSLLPRLCRAVKQATAAEGFNVIVNNGRVAGQTVFHGHWHIIPRWHDDAVRWPWPHVQYAGDELARLQSAIQRALEAGPAA